MNLSQSYELAISIATDADNGYLNGFTPKQVETINDMLKVINLELFWKKEDELKQQQQELESLKAQLAQYQSDDYVLVLKEVPEHIAENLAKEIVLKPNLENDHVLFDLQNKVYEAELDRKKWELYRNYRDMIEAQEQHNG